MVILNMTKDLIWENIHRICDRTSCRTLLALIAVLYGFTTGLTDFEQKGIIFLICLLSWIHFLPRLVDRLFLQDCLSPLVNGKFNRKGRSFSHFTPYADLSSMILNNPIRSGEA